MASAAAIQLRTSSTPTVSKSKFTQPDASATDSDQRFGDALKSAQAKSDAAADENVKNDAKSDAAAHHAANAGKSKHAVKQKDKHGDKSASDDTDGAEHGAVAADGSDTPHSDETDAKAADSKAVAAEEEVPEEPSNAQLSAAASQNAVVPTPQLQPAPAPVVNKLPVPTALSAGQEAAVQADAGEKIPLPQHEQAKDAAKGAELANQKTPDVDAVKPKQVVNEDAKPKAADTKVSEQEPEPLAISKPAKNPHQNQSGADGKNTSQQNGQGQQTVSAQAPATPSVSSETIAEQLSSTQSSPEPEQSAPAHDNSLGTTAIGVSHTVTQPSDNRAEAAANAQDPQPIDPDQTFEQVVLGLRGKLDARNGKAEIRLDPPNLGTLHVSINLDKGALTAQFSSASSSVRDLLKGNMEKLKTVLESQGVSVDKLSVESPAEKPGAVPSSNQTGTANHDGRSAGEYTQDQRSGRKRPEENGTFARLWKNSAAEEAPIDLVA